MPIGSIELAPAKVNLFLHVTGKRADGYHLLDSLAVFAGIADRLFLSRHTVKTQLESMYRKLDVHSRDAAVARAREVGLLE